MARVLFAKDLLVNQNNATNQLSPWVFVGYLWRLSYYVHLTGSPNGEVHFLISADDANDSNITPRFALAQSPTTLNTPGSRVFSFEIPARFARFRWIANAGSTGQISVQLMGFR